jgi:hypothetical protein
MIRGPTEDPRIVMVGRAHGTWLKHEMCMVRFVDGAFAGLLHCAGQAGESFEDGDLVVLRSGIWRRA